MPVHCGTCRHEWFAFKSPIPLFVAAKLAANMRCPKCDGSSDRIFCGPAPDAMTDVLVKRLRSHNGPFNWEDAVATYLEAADRIERLEAALNDMVQYISLEDWDCFLKPETRKTVEETI
jgi:HAMP domain-containing protein